MTVSIDYDDHPDSPSALQEVRREETGKVIEDVIPMDSLNGRTIKTAVLVDGKIHLTLED